MNNECVMATNYGVFAGSKFGLTTRKKEALKCAKEHKGEVRVFANFYGPDYPSFDAPTFRILSEPVADFRGVA